MKAKGLRRTLERRKNMMRLKWEQMILQLPSKKMPFPRATLNKKNYKSLLLILMSLLTLKTN